jgi:hypothetical protein
MPRDLQLEESILNSPKDVVIDAINQFNANISVKNMLKHHFCEGISVRKMMESNSYPFGQSKAIKERRKFMNFFDKKYQK